VLSSNISDGLWLRLHSGNTQAEKHCLSGKTPQRDFEELKKNLLSVFLLTK
jgi:hypothetical protein